MTGRPAPHDPRYAATWVHAFEEDAPGVAVYRPEGAELPLSRRPRERLELAPDGSARAYAAGPDDRPRPRPATWQVAGAASGPDAARSAEADYHVVEWTAERLVVRR